MTKLTKANKKVKPKQPVSITLPKNSIKKDYYLPAILLSIFAFGIVRLGLLDVPLERDEGEYAYFASLLLDGIPPYKEAYNMKLPGTYFIYAVFIGIFGKTITAVHIGLLLTNSITIFFLFISLRKLFNAPLAFFAACTYGLMSVSGVFLGFAAHATHFVSLFLALGLYFFSKYSVDQKKLYSFLCGAMMGLSFLMKQQAVFYILLGGLMLLAYAWQHKIHLKSAAIDFAFYSLGAVLPYLLTAFFLYLAGAFDNFWFWTFEYASKYVSGLTWEDGRTQLKNVFTLMWAEHKIFWILFFAGIPSLFMVKKYSTFQKVFSIALLSAAVLTVVPGFYFRQHYFISFLPVVGLFAAFTLEYLRELAGEHMSFKKTYYAPVLIFSILFLVVINADKYYYMQPEPNAVSKRFYRNNPFVESPLIAEYIQNNTSTEDRIAVLGSEPQIYFYANRKSSTGYIYTYAMMESHDYNLGMQEQMIREIEANTPKYLVFCGISTSWLKQANSPDHIFKWYDTFRLNYSLEGIVDITSNGTIYKWGTEALSYTPISQNLLIILRKK